MGTASTDLLCLSAGFIGFVDVLVLYLLLSAKRLTSPGHGNKGWAVGVAWALAESVCYRFVPLWVGARGVQFDAAHLHSSAEANISLLSHLVVASCCVQWLRRRQLAQSHVRLVIGVLALDKVIQPVVRGFIVRSLFAGNLLVDFVVHLGFTVLEFVLLWPTKATPSKWEVKIQAGASNAK